MKKHIKINRSNAVNEIEKLINEKRYFEALLIVQRFKVNGMTVTGNTLKKEYGITEKQIKKLSYIEVPNPHFRCSGNMKLYLKSEAKTIQQPRRILVPKN